MPGLAPNTQIYEDGEYCVVCLGTERLGEWHLIGTDASGKTEPFSLTVCNPCYANRTTLHAWLAAEMEAAMEADPTMIKLPDGRWTKREGNRAD